jgi:hypothetical protein
VYIEGSYSSLLPKPIKSFEYLAGIRIFLSRYLAIGVASLSNQVRPHILGTL